ncbi:MAG: conserved rane protein of unknown function [Actinomycetospora sp.]|nr:conserved rane protein of unknown function [Actinomycetospora sp.]
MNAALSFYQLLTTVSFTLLGLWFVVLGLDPRWRQDPTRHRASLHTTLMFFLPGVMGLGSVLSGGDALFWRAFFVVGGLAGLAEAVAYLRAPADGDRVLRALAPPAYAAVVAAAVLPGPVLGLVPLQVEGLATGLVFVGGTAGLWLALTRSREPAARPGPGIVTPVGRPR